MEYGLASLRAKGGGGERVWERGGSERKRPQNLPVTNIDNHRNKI